MFPVESSAIRISDPSNRTSGGNVNSLTPSDSKNCQDERTNPLSSRNSTTRIPADDDTTFLKVHVQNNNILFREKIKTTL
jgi:hypothetical protein